MLATASFLLSHLTSGIMAAKYGLDVRRVILQAMFTGLYFDAQNYLWKVAAHDPFDRLLGLAKNGSAKTLP